MDIENHTPKTGAPFPFKVEHVSDLSLWEPKPRTIAVDEAMGRFRVLDNGGSDTVTANALRRIVAEFVGDRCIEWTEEQKQQPPPDDEQGEPDEP